MTITDDELARLEALAKEASPGPWLASKRRACDSWRIVSGDVLVAWTPRGDGQLKNVEAICVARDAVPALVAEVREMYKHAANMATLLGEARQAHDEVCAERDALRAENERLRRENERMIEGAPLTTYEADVEIDRLRAEAAELRASLEDAVARMERMEPVVEAARLRIHSAPNTTARIATDYDLADAVDAYEASLPGIVKEGP